MIECLLHLQTFPFDDVILFTHGNVALLRFWCVDFLGQAVLRALKAANFFLSLDWLG